MKFSLLLSTMFYIIKIVNFDVDEEYESVLHLIKL